MQEWVLLPPGMCSALHSNQFKLQESHLLGWQVISGKWSSSQDILARGTCDMLKEQKLLKTN